MYWLPLDAERGCMMALAMFTDLLCLKDGRGEPYKSGLLSDGTGN